MSMYPEFIPTDWLSPNHTFSAAKAALPGLRPERSKRLLPRALKEVSAPCVSLGVSSKVHLGLEKDGAVVEWALPFPVDPETPDQPLHVGRALEQLVSAVVGDPASSTLSDRTIDMDDYSCRATWTVREGGSLSVEAGYKKSPYPREAQAHLMLVFDASPSRAFVGS